MIDIEAIETAYQKAVQGPVFVSPDDAKDVPAHANSGLAMIDTGRVSDWHYGRLMEWSEATFVAALINAWPQIRR